MYSLCKMKVVDLTLKYYYFEKMGIHIINLYLVKPIFKHQKTWK